MAYGYRVLISGLLLALAAGCGKEPPLILPVEGVVRLDGKPLPKARVMFLPKTADGQSLVATGLTDENGRYQLTCNGQPGACAGENRVLVLEADPPKELLGEKPEAQRGLARYYESLGNRPIPGNYGTVVQSPLRANVTADQVEYDFDLKR